MMDNQCWRIPRPKLIDHDDKVWPKLSHPPSEERSLVMSSPIHRFPQLLPDLGRGSEVSDLHENLNEMDYPKLGELVLKRKHSLIDDDPLDAGDESRSKECRRPRLIKSSDMNQINLQNTLESLQTQILPLPPQTEQPSRINVDICKLNVDMRMSAPLECKLPGQKLQRTAGHIAKKKKKKPSRNKLLTIHQEIEAQKRQICKDADGDVEETDLDKLGMDAATHDDPDLVTKMAALSCLSTNYRNTRQVTISEETVTFRPDVHENMDNLSMGGGDNCRFEEVAAIKDSNVPDAEAIDCDAVDSARSLKICDETGENNDNIPTKQEPGRVQFSKNFQEYCTNTVTPDLRKHLGEFLAEIKRLQKRMYERDNVKGKSKRRYYAGIKEVHKQIDFKKIKFVVIAPDIEKVEMEDVSDGTLNILVGTCKRHRVPYCFGLGRRKLGYYTHGNGFVSCIGISNYSGAEEKFKNVLSDVVEARNEFARLFGDETRTIDLAKLLSKEELILSEVINVYSRILASSS